MADRENALLRVQEEMRCDGAAALSIMEFVGWGRKTRQGKARSSQCVPGVEYGARMGPISSTTRCPIILGSDCHNGNKCCYGFSASATTAILRKPTKKATGVITMVSCGR